MKFIINEDRISKLFDKYMDIEYGNLKLVKNPPLKEYNLVNEDGKKIFEINYAGVMWVPNDLLDELYGVFGGEFFSSLDIESHLMEYFDRKYGFKPKKINVYF